MEDRKVRILLEDINHKIDSIIEVIADNPARFDRIEKDIKEMKEDIKVIKLTLPQKANLSDFKKVQKDVSILKTKIA